MTPKRTRITHRIIFSGLAPYGAGDRIGVDGPEGYHAATVKRCSVGDAVGVLDGCGHTGAGTVVGISGHKSKPRVEIELAEVAHTPRSTPTVEVWTALPKGDRLEAMIDRLSQLGVSRWRAVGCDRSERKWSSVRVEKLVRATHESAKQCGRAWFLEIGEPVAFDEAIACDGVVVAHGDGATLCTRSGIDVIILIGPEGGWSDVERGRVGELSVPTVRLGGHVLRLETAACAAAAVFVNLESEGNEE